MLLSTIVALLSWLGLLILLFNPDLWLFSPVLISKLVFKFKFCAAVTTKFLEFKALVVCIFGYDSKWRTGEVLVVLFYFIFRFWICFIKESRPVPPSKVSCSDFWILSTLLLLSRFLALWVPAAVATSERRCPTLVVSIDYSTETSFLWATVDCVKLGLNTEFLPLIFYPF